MDCQFHKLCCDNDVNIGSNCILETLCSTHEGKDVVYDVMKRQAEMARQTFRPEFLNFIDEYIVFQPLDSKEICKIVEIGLNKRKLIFTIQEATVNLPGTVGFDPNFTARTVKKVTQQLVRYTISMAMLRGDIKEEDADCC